jgi:hypothetical protein
VQCKSSVKSFPANPVTDSNRQSRLRQLIFNAPDSQALILKVPSPLANDGSGNKNWDASFTTDKRGEITYE